MWVCENKSGSDPGLTRKVSVQPLCRADLYF
uniref:Uncharacterized protein n=1 Tax=Anguilla anguilla TaxID=7936 RepID=A0A0E9QVD3_ANGAN